MKKTHKSTINKTNIPNIITFFRIFLIIIIIALNAWIFSLNDLNDENKWFSFLLPNKSLFLWITILILFFIATITDFFDGYLARKWNVISSTGKILDPIADKMLTITLLVVLASFRIIYVWLTLLLIMRELIINSFRMVYLKKNTIIQAKWHGKLKTIILFIGILFSGILYPLKLDLDEQLTLFINSSVLLLACVFSYFSLFKYIFPFLKKSSSKFINNT